MLPQMILAREPILAHAPAPFLRAVVTGRDFREMGGGVAGEVEGTGELAGAEGVEAGEGCCFRRRGGVVGRGDGGAVGGGAGVSLGGVLFWGGKIGGREKRVDLRKGRRKNGKGGEKREEENRDRCSKREEKKPRVGRVEGQSYDGTWNKKDRAPYFEPSLDLC